ncbi:MAG: hypothetical protein LBJ39_02180, partial [Tannerellaceae bacterium]|nr:hypothetical protein [Tannerellaceae bacterium]
PPVSNLNYPKKKAKNPPPQQNYTHNNQKPPVRNLTYPIGRLFSIVGISSGHRNGCFHPSECLPVTGTAVSNGRDVFR